VSCDSGSLTDEWLQRKIGWGPPRMRQCKVSGGRPATQGVALSYRLAVLLLPAREAPASPEWSAEDSTPDGSLRPAGGGNQNCRREAVSFHSLHQ
jgi:hypothetical protein